ncbi:MAG: response regulator, partial [Bacteroidales bacterium]|nr:response regulator [Bacteroidales bacterium]
RESFINYTTEHGLVNNIVYGILEDEDWNLWLSTDNGLSKFNLTNNEFTNYSISDGLLTNQFYWSACFKNESGRMYFGGMNGLLTFEPEKIIDRDFAHNLSLTSFKIYNQPVVIGKEYYDQVLIDRSVSRIDKICLPYKIKEFSLEFSALDYHQTDKIQYAYMLEGFDEGWNYVGADRRFVSYTNLKGGDYRLIIKTSLKEGKWSDQPLNVALQIIPPVWERWWFITLAISALIFSIIGYNRYRTFALKERKRMLEILVKERTYQIEGQKEQLEMQNLEIIEQRDKLMDLNKKVQEANRNQMRFFTHMSHEFRTPLMLIISPLEELTRKMPEASGNVLGKLVLMKKNAKRLLHLVNQLMEVRRIKTGNIELKASETDLVKFLGNISQPFSSLASQKNISYDLVSYEKSIITYADTEKLEVIFYNLLSNAIKYTPEYGYINIEIKLTEHEAVNEIMQDEIPVLKQKLENGYRYISITVSDSGIGVESEHLKEIFKRFYKAPSEYNKYSYGTGIGLYLTKELIKAHRGLLYVRSKPGEGSSFRFLIPYGKEYLKENEISEKQNSSPFEKNENLQAGVLDEYLENTREKKPSHSYTTEKQIIAKPLILIVDDDPELCDYIAEFFADEFEVLIAENGEDGLEKAKKYLPDLILSDNMMPKMDG